MKLNRSFISLSAVFFAWQSLLSAEAALPPLNESEWQQQSQSSFNSDLNQSEPIAVAKSDDTEFELGKMDSSPATGSMTNEQLEQLLDKRLSGTMEATFSQFANMYLIPNQAKSGQAVSLETTSDKIEKTMLRSPFPAFYRPTLRQFLDEMAWQTKSKWKFDSDDKSLKPKSQGSSAVKQLALIDFFEAENIKPYGITLATGWTASDKGNWTMCSPPRSPLSLDIYEMGSYTAQDKTAEAALLKKVPEEVALAWAKRVQVHAKQSDLSEAKVGPFNAVYFETKVKSQAKHNVSWRQWVFMDGKQCYFIVSTIFPEDEAKMLPEVKAMLKSFHSKN